MRIGVASSGLGHVTRGIEAWTAYLGKALAERGEEVVVFRAAGEPTHPYERLVPCWKRSDAKTLRLVRWMPRPMWRLGLTQPYTVEQTSFALNLLPHLRRERIDVLHVKDPQLALIVQRANKFGLVRTRAILSHGTEEPFWFLRKITYLHHLSPAHEAEARANAADKPTWRMISNFLDTDLFHPGRAPELRRQLGIPDEGLVVLCAAAIKSGHKRIDYLLDEFHSLRQARPDLPVWLVIAGGRGGDSDQIMEKGRALLGDRVRFLLNYPLAKMPELYRAADLFVLCSLKEMLGTVLLEASATGVPCLVHQHPSMEWVIGSGGASIDMTQPGALARAMGRYLSDRELLTALGSRARAHCVATFGRDHIVRQYIDYYSAVISDQNTSSFSRGQTPVRA